MGRWLATLLLALAIAVPGSGAEGEPGGRSYQAEGAPKPGQESSSVAPRRPAQIMAPVDSPSGIEGKSGHRGHEAEQQNRAADPIWVSANAARDTARYTRGLLYVGAIGILVGFATIGAAIWAGRHAKLAAIEAGKSAKAAIASHEAFVAAEDASLDISFPEGSKIHQAVDGEATDFYYLKPHVVNIGRSTAQISGWRHGAEKPHRKQYTVVPGKGVVLARMELTIAPGEEFVLTIPYSTPIRRSLELEVTARLRLKVAENGQERIFAQVLDTRLCQASVAT